MAKVRVDAYLETHDPKNSELIGSFTAEVDGPADSAVDELLAEANEQFGADGWDSVQFWEITERCFEVVTKKK